MTVDKYKQLFGEATAEALHAAYPEAAALEDNADAFSLGKVLEGLETPKDPAMGRLAFPVFRYARLLKARPQEIAARLADEINRRLKDQAVLSLRAVAVGGYLNGQVDTTVLASETVAAALNRGSSYGDSSVGGGKTCLVEYSSPNIAKPFGVGHLRSTIIGNSLRRIFAKLGYAAVGINYPGDWGTQFGKMIVARRKWGSDGARRIETVKELLDLYVRFHHEAAKNPGLEEDARQAFKSLEDGDPEALSLWRRFKEISHAEFNRIYALLGIEFDWTYGESDLNDKMEPLIERLSRAALTSWSQGALVVELNDEQLPPLLLKKSDGATLYATRDLAGMIYRWEKYPDFYESLYVVNVAQSDHFKQCFRVIDLLEEAEGVTVDRRQSRRLHHVDFGWVRFEGRMMSTRQGNIVLLEEVIAQATELARDRIKEKNPGLAAIDDTAQMIGVGAVIFSQLSVRRQRDVDFRWEEVLNFEGETGPYLQYTHARLCSVLRRYGREVGADVDYSLLNQTEEQRVIDLLADFPETVQTAAEQYDPFFISSHLLKLAAAFNKVYQRKDAGGQIDKIISENAALTAARMALVKAVKVVLNEGLRLLGLPAPQEM